MQAQLRMIFESGSSQYNHGTETENNTFAHYYVAEMDTSTPPEPTGNIDYNASPSHLGGQTDNNGVVTNWGPGWDNWTVNGDLTLKTRS